MSVVTYNKLVRDKIPKIIKDSGRKCNVTVLSDMDYQSALNIKLGEELNEYLESGSVEELADLAEVMYAIIKVKGITIDEFERIRIEKQEARGGFDKKILLESVSD